MNTFERRVVQIDLFGLRNGLLISSVIDEKDDFFVLVGLQLYFALHWLKSLSLEFKGLK
jgi:hypothetical protein